MGQRVIPGVHRAFIANVAQHTRVHPAHGFTLVQCLSGHFRSMEVHYPDDPLLAAPYILDELRRIEGLIRSLHNWATAVDACDPADSPERGARLCK